LLVDRNAKSDQTLKAILHDQFRRALLAFPDEDVLLGSRLTSPDGFRAFAGLDDVVPRLGYKPTGEDRAWGRRLAKRFGSEKSIDDKTFIMTVTPGPVGGLDYTAAKGPVPDGVDDVLRRASSPQGRAPGRLRLGHGRVTRLGQTAQVVSRAAAVPVQLL
jgi:hypothetical protein